MSRRRNDRALERAAAGLARLHPEDAAGVLDALAPGERARLDALLAPPPPEEPEPVWTWAGVSPWLLDRLDPDSRAFVLMTPTAAEALRAAAEPLRVQAGARAGATLLARAMALLTGARP